MEPTAAPRHHAREVAVRASFSLGANAFSPPDPDLKRGRRLGRAQALDFPQHVYQAIPCRQVVDRSLQQAS